MFMKVGGWEGSQEMARHVCGFEWQDEGQEGHSQQLKAISMYSTYFDGVLMLEISLIWMNVEC